MIPRCDCGGIPRLEYRWGPDGLEMRKLICDRCGTTVPFTSSTTATERMWMVICGAHAPQMRLDE